MVGGIVVEIVHDGERIWVNARDTRHGEGECAIFVKDSPDARAIKFGDAIWWQGSRAYWTPRDGSVVDKPLERIGFSGVNRPNVVN